MAKIFVTGTAGFIGFHLTQFLLNEGHIVHGFDGITNYYDTSLKLDRNKILESNSNYIFTKGMLEDFDQLNSAISEFQPNIVIHLAAQAGVRYSIENPRAYIETNIVGTFNVLEMARKNQINHLMMASTSSVYGANLKMPFLETDRTDTPLTLYAASKKSTELIAHSYSNLWKIPTTMFRFFTVYGPWGRPDMALFKFTKGILEDTPIDIYNHGEMFRDFTYVDDLVKSISLLKELPPAESNKSFCKISNDSLSPVAPFRVVNIGNSNQIKLIEFIEALEKELGIQAKRNYMDMQMGDVPATYADNALLEELTGFTPETDYKTGIKKFVKWYKDYYCK